MATTTPPPLSSLIRHVFACMSSLISTRAHGPLPYACLSRLISPFLLPLGSPDCFSISFSLLFSVGCVYRVVRDKVNKHGWLGMS
jgi:hypothetical protein